MLPYGGVIAGSSTNITNPTTPQINQGFNPLTVLESNLLNGYMNQASAQVEKISTEIINVIEAAGLTPDATLDQLLEAIQVLAVQPNASSFVAGIIKTALAADVNTGTATDKAITPSALAGRAMFSVYRSTSAQTITANVSTKAQFNNIGLNQGSYFDGSTYRFTPPAGTYFLGSMMLMGNSGGGSFTANNTITINGVGQFAGSQLSLTSGQNSWLNAHGIYTFNGTDYAEVYCTISAGTTPSFGIGSNFFGFKL